MADFEDPMTGEPKVYIVGKGVGIIREATEEETRAYRDREGSVHHLRTEEEVRPHQ